MISNQTLSGISGSPTTYGSISSQPAPEGDFLTRVSFAGVPHTLPHDSDISQATLFPITPSLACKLYWMLSSLTADYTYSINGVHVSRSFSASTTVVPKNRMIAPAMIYETAYDTQIQTSYLMKMSLDKVYFNGNNNSEIGFNLRIEESDNYDIMKLCLYPAPEMNNISLNFTFMDQPLSAYLNFNPSLVTSATLTNFSLTPQFFEI
ncbi:MAG: hypothetical protein LBB18_00305 [Puniceicoccales bacterium]|jgi:hypothetical protein|nr:hypothetical protein [Puniceicoccales bacterium]